MRLLIDDVVSLLEEIRPFTGGQEVAFAEDLLETVAIIFIFVLNICFFIFQIKLLDLVKCRVTQSVTHLGLILLGSSHEGSICNDIDSEVVWYVFIIEEQFQLPYEMARRWLGDLEHLIRTRELMILHPLRHLTAVEDLQHTAAVEPILAGNDKLPTDDGIQKGNVVVWYEVAGAYA